MSGDKLFDQGVEVFHVASIPAGLGIPDHVARIEYRGRATAFDLERERERLRVTFGRLWDCSVTVHTEEERQALPRSALGEREKTRFTRAADLIREYTGELDKLRAGETSGHTLRLQSHYAQIIERQLRDL